MQFREGGGGEERINKKDKYKNTPTTVFKEEMRLRNLFLKTSSDPN